MKFKEQKMGSFCYNLDTVKISSFTGSQMNMQGSRIRIGWHINKREKECKDGAYLFLDNSYSHISILVRNVGMTV